MKTKRGTLFSLLALGLLVAAPGANALAVPVGSLLGLDRLYDIVDRGLPPIPSPPSVPAVQADYCALRTESSDGVSEVGCVSSKDPNCDVRLGTSHDEGDSLCVGSRRDNCAARAEQQGSRYSLLCAH